jgi:hypothetical protein
VQKDYQFLGKETKPLNNSGLLIGPQVLKRYTNTLQTLRVIWVGSFMSQHHFSKTQPQQPKCTTSFHQRKPKLEEKRCNQPALEHNLM